jgi:ABC-type nickel/cobalt efflux system permease component RcnA
MLYVDAIASTYLRMTFSQRNLMEANLIGLGIKQMLALNLITAAAILLIWYLTHKAENAKWEKQRLDQQAEREADRSERKDQADEHMKKWDSVMLQHKEELVRQAESHAKDTDRLMRLLEREVQVGELHANLLQALNSKIDGKLICPRE